jgi:prepilin-type processing-associated H-X9-DG protein
MWNRRIQRISRQPSGTFPRHRIGATQTELIVNGIIIFVCCSVALSLILPAGPPSREAAPRAICQSHMRNLGLAILNYAAEHDGFLPPPYLADDTGRPIHSWRVLMLPYIDRRDLYDKYRFDEPWDGPHNRQLHDTMIEVFCCPEAGRPSTSTNYVVVRGNETAWPDSQQIKLDEISSADGLEHTLLLVETAETGIHWMEPRDDSFSKIPLRLDSSAGPAVSSRHPGVVNVIFCDGRVKPLSQELPPATIRALLTVRGGEKIRDGDY